MKVRTKLALMLSFTLVFTALAAGGWAADDARPSNPTFHKDIVPILQANCQGCHRPSGLNLGGMIAPMALIDYREVRPWARSIAEKVESREMPPWFATEDTHGQSGSREWLTPDLSLVETELGSEYPHLVLEQVTEGLQKLVTQLRGETSNVVMCIDGG